MKYLKKFIEISNKQRVFENNSNFTNRDKEYFSSNSNNNFIPEKQIYLQLNSVGPKKIINEINQINENEEFDYNNEIEQFNQTHYFRLSFNVKQSFFPS